MIVASLLVMSLIVFVSFSYQLDTRLEQARNQGVGLAKVLSSMSWNELVPERGRQGILQALRQGQSNPDFAYAVVVDLQGKAASEISAPGVIIPNNLVPDSPTAWLGERRIDAQSGQLSFLEFHAPVFSDSELRGYVRLGYKQPEFHLTYDDLPFFGMLTLPVFLLTPMLYFLARRELQPLRKMNDNIERLLEGGATQKVELQPSGELGDFMQRFSTFISASQQRIEVLENEQGGLLTSSKLLAYQNSKIESILQTLPEAIIIIDESGCVTYANDKITSLLGKTRESILGKKPQEWCKEPKLHAYLSRHNATSKQVGFISASIHITPENDPEKLLEIKAYPLFLPKSDVLSLGNLVVIRDITEEQMAKVNRGEFLAQMAHELKTPLNVLSMYSELLLGEEGNSESFRIEAMNVIHDETERLSNLINNMLAISKFELGGMQINRQRVRIGELLQDTYQTIVQSGRGRDLDFAIDLPHEMSALNVDKDLLRIAVNNLLTNAIKYNKPKGSVTLRAIELDDAIEISVSDTGVGISRDDQARIFEKFYRSDDDKIREQTGHGLGLSLVEQIVHTHHGKILVDSDYGNGSTFTIRLEKDLPVQQLQTGAL